MGGFAGRGLVSILCPLAAIHALLVLTLVDMSADSTERKRHIAGLQLKVQRRRRAVKHGRVVRAPALPPSKGKTWPGARKSRRLLQRTDVRDLLEHLVIASQHGGASGEEDSEGTDHGWDREDVNVDKANMTSFLNWNKIGSRMRKREK